MLQFKTWRRAVLALHVFLGTTLLAGTAQIVRAEDHAREEGKFLFVCVGDQARTSPDFLAVVDFDDDSPHYGKVIATAPLPEPGATVMSSITSDFLPMAQWWPVVGFSAY